jgi:hypothetical protein
VYDNCSLCLKSDFRIGPLSLSLYIYVYVYCSACRVQIRQILTFRDKPSSIFSTFLYLFTSSTLLTNCARTFQTTSILSRKKSTQVGRKGLRFLYLSLSRLSARACVYSLEGAEGRKLEGRRETAASDIFGAITANGSYFR